MKYIALLRRLIGKPVPATPVATTVVYRGERVLTCGPCRLGCPGKVPAKLSIDDARRCFGVEQGAA